MRLDDAQAHDPKEIRMADALFVLTLVTALGAAVGGGVFFAFSNFVMAALGRIRAPEGIRAMQEINITVITPLFMTAIFGTGVACLAIAIVALADWNDDYGPYLIAAAVLYVLGSVGVTMVFNVPRNNALARVDPESAEGESVWRRYLVEWTAWNTVRTVACLATTGLLIGAVAAG
jgi:uncharacterized membrane protein